MGKGRNILEDGAKRVGIWVRVSTEDQVRGESPETHERRARLYAEAKGWNVVELYRLDAVSGKTVKDTPEAKQMLADIKDGHITGLIFSKLARLARNTKELLDFSEEFRKYDADLISLAESIDTSTPAGRLFYTMIAAMAQWEREEISERVAASVPIRARAGKPTGGQASFGYQWKDKELLVDSKEAPVRKLIFELFREHQRKKTVARILNERGYRTRKGAKFSDTTIDRLLSDPIAKGLRRANYTTNPTSGSKGAWVLKPESEWIHLEVEPIVSEELWNECNHYLTEQRKNRKRRAKSVVHLLSGLTYCECGHKMYVPSNNPKYTCNKCRNKIPTEDLEAVFHHQIKGFLFSDKEIAMHLEQANEVLKEKAELLGVLEKQAQKLATEIDKLYDLYQSGMIDKSGFGAKYKPLAERRDQLDNQIPELQAEIDILKITHLSQEVAIEEARDLHTRWPGLPKEEKRRIVEAIVERIVVGDGEVSISLYYTPPPPPTGRGGGSSTNQGGHSPPYTSSENRGNLAMNPQGCVAFLPFAHVSLKSLIPKPYDFEPKTLGEHVRKKRLKMGLMQKDVANQLGVVPWTILNWEKGRTVPPTSSIPAIVQFLGYDPFSEPKTLPQHLLAKRREAGWSIKEAAEAVGVDPCTWGNWERGKLILYRQHRTIVARFLGLSANALDQEMASRWNRLHERVL